MTENGNPSAPADAAGRVRQEFAREAARLEQRQEDTRKRDAREQSRALERAADTRKTLEDARRRELERHDRLWEQQKARMSPAAVPAPSFGPGGPPRRPGPGQFTALAEAHLQRREDLSRQYDERIERCRENEERLRADFALAVESRERQQVAEKEELFREQARFFERRVEQEHDAQRQRDQAGREQTGEAQSLQRSFRGRAGPEREF